MKKEVDPQEDLIDLLSEMLKWVKFIGKKQLKELLADTLKEDLEKIVYELSDGKSLRDIVRICKNNGYSTSTFTGSKLWEKWSVVGIVEPSKKYQGRSEHIVSLKEVGIDFPPIILGKKKG